MRTFKRTKTAPKTKPTPTPTSDASKQLVFSKDVTGDGYHEALIDPSGGQPYLSSSTLKALFKQSLFTNNSPSMEFGKAVHSAAEFYLEGRAFIATNKMDYKKRLAAGEIAEGTEFLELKYENDRETFKHIFPMLAQYIDKIKKDSNNVMVERNYFLPQDSWPKLLQDEKLMDSIPPCLNPLLTFMLQFRLPLKVMSDLYVEYKDGRCMIVDWKTTSSSTPNDLRWDAQKYGYIFSMMLYALVFMLAGHRVDGITLVFVPKSKGAQTALVEMGLDFGNVKDCAMIKEYLSKFMPSAEQFEAVRRFKSKLTKGETVTVPLYL